jgi:hypothetical protein
MPYLPSRRTAISVLALLVLLTGCGPEKSGDPETGADATDATADTAAPGDTNVPEDAADGAPADTADTADTGDTGETSPPEDTATPDDTGGTPDASAGLEIESVIPKSGPASGGTQISVIGTGFQEGAKLTVGPRETEFTTVISSQKINGKTTGAPSPGLYDVTVEQNGQSDTMRKIFEYQ